MLDDCEEELDVLLSGDDSFRRHFKRVLGLLEVLGVDKE